MIKEVGEIELKEANEMNIPVNCFLNPPEETDSKKWEWTADNFMPRKGRCGESEYQLIADTKDEILEQVKKYVVPFYKIALSNLETTGVNYYWETNDETK